MIKDPTLLSAKAKIDRTAIRRKWIWRTVKIYALIFGAAVLIGFVTKIAGAW